MRAFIQQVVAPSILIFCLCKPLLGQGTVVTEVLTGNAIPGTSDHFTQFAQPFISENGDIVFWASGTQTSGVWLKRRSNGQIISVFQQGDTVPTPTGTATLNSASLFPGINRNRQVAVRASVGSPAHGGVWVRNVDTGAVTLVAFDGQSAPGTSETFVALAVFDVQHTEDRRVPINRQGSVLFESYLSDDNLGVWSRVGTTVGLVIERGAVPLVIPSSTVDVSDWTVEDVFSYTINRNDNVAFIANAVSPPHPPVPSDSYFALWIGSTGSAGINVWSGIGFGGEYHSGQFDLEWDTTLDGLNLASFAADRITTQNGQIVSAQTWSLLSNSRFLVAQTCGDIHYVGGGAAVLNGGQALFVAIQDTDPSSGHSCQNALGFSAGDSGSPVVVAHPGLVLLQSPGLPVVSVISNQFALNANARMAFLGANGTSATIFTGVASAKRVFRAISVNDTITVPLGGGFFDDKMVTSIVWGRPVSSETNFSPPGTENGYGLMSDCGLGTVVFGLTFDDGASGIFTCGIPHPGDINFDGTLDSQDFFLFLGWYFSGDGRADFNMDGVVNSQDYFDFNAAYFSPTPDPCS